MAVTVGSIAQTIKKVAPKYWAEEWDNVGLLVGNMADSVARVLLAVDGTPEVVAEASERDAEMIVAHHPLMFRPLKNLRADNPQAEVPLKLLKHGISYYAAHTNLDQSRFSSSWLLGQSLGLREMDYLAVTGYETLDLSPLQNRGQARGYGIIGYLPQAESLGSVWQRLTALLRDEPWAEIQYRVNNDYVSEQRPVHERNITDDMVTDANSGKTAKLCLGGIRLAGDLAKPVRKVAIVNGSGGSFVQKALFQGADLFIAGDIDHHAALDALQGGMTVADIGHFISERPMLYNLAHYLRSAKALQGVEFIISAADKSPWIVQTSEKQ